MLPQSTGDARIPFSLRHSTRPEQFFSCVQLSVPNLTDLAIRGRSGKFDSAYRFRRHRSFQREREISPHGPLNMVRPIHAAV